MELFQELFLTASLALVLSFLVAKLVSVAMAGDTSGESDSGRNVGGEIVMEEIRFGEKLTVQSFESERKVDEFVQEETVKKVENFEGEGEGERPVQDEEVVEITHRAEEISQEIRELPGKLSEGSGLGGESEEAIGSPEQSPEIVGFPEGNIDDSLKESFENRGVEEMGMESAAENEVTARNEEIRVSESAEKEEKEVRLDSDEDEWEGIERSELEKAFNEAAKFVDGSKDKEDILVSVGSDTQMELYGLHKVATEGTCREPQPMALKLSARAKWNAWQRLGNMSPEVAMEQYINILSDRVPGWKEDNSAGVIKPESSEAGISTTVAPDQGVIKPESSDAGISTMVAPDQGVIKPESSEAGISTTVAPNLQKNSHHQPNYIDQREPEPNTGAVRGDQTGGSYLDDGVKE